MYVSFMLQKHFFNLFSLILQTLVSNCVIFDAEYKLVAIIVFKILVLE